MRIGVIGTFIRDRILPWQGEETESIGGIFFTVSYLASLMNSSGQICPVAFVGADFYPELCGQLSEYPNVDLSGVKKLPRDNTQVTLTYSGPEQRDEVTTAPMPPLGADEIQKLSGFDAVIVNLITGTDVQLDALQRFRKNNSTLLYLDFHSRALGIDDNGHRYYRRPDDWQQWIDVADVLQLNEMEALTLSGSDKPLSGAAQLELGKSMLERNPTVCHLTLADRGSLLFYEDTDQIKAEHIPGIKPERIVDIIGCGDAFEAGYVVKYLGERDIVQATRFANRIAAYNCTFVGSSGVKRIRESLVDV